MCIQDFVSGSTFKESRHSILQQEVEQIEKSVTLLGFIRDWRIEGKLLPQYWRGKQRLKKKKTKNNTFGTVTKGITYVHMVISIEETEKGKEILETMTDFTPN